MKIGLTQGTAEVDKQNFTCFAAGLGITGVEPYIGDIGSEYLTRPVEAAQNVRRAATAVNITVPSVAMSVFNGDPSLIDGKNPDRAVTLLRSAMIFTHGVGARTMLLCTYLASVPDTTEKRRTLVDIIHRIEPEARSMGLTLALETPLPADRLASFVDDIDSESVGVYYDTGNAVALGFDPAAELLELGTRVVGLHLKDSVDRLGALHIGAGHVDFDEVFDAVNRIGYDGWLMLETPGDDAAAIRGDIKRCLAILILQLENQIAPAGQMRTAHGR